jgi:hypothetical protein
MPKDTASRCQGVGRFLARAVAVVAGGEQGLISPAEPSTGRRPDRIRAGRLREPAACTGAGQRSFLPACCRPPNSMSKSLGNGVDLGEQIERLGADRSARPGAAEMPEGTLGRARRRRDCEIQGEMLARLDRDLLLVGAPVGTPRDYHV